MNKHFEVYKTVSLEQGLEILNMCSQKRSKDINVSGELVKIQAVAMRQRLIRQGYLFCTECGREGTHFNIFRDVRDNRTTYQISLFCFDKNHGEIGFNHDHIIPKSLGGFNTLANARLTCECCNKKKADSLDLDEVVVLINKKKLETMTDIKLLYKHVKAKRNIFLNTVNQVKKPKRKQQMIEELSLLDSIINVLHSGLLSI